MTKGMRKEGKEEEGMKKKLIVFPLISLPFTITIRSFGNV